MTTPSTLPFDACRAQTCAALQMLAAGQQWRETWLTLQRRRLSRDSAALRGTLEAMRDANDWNDFAVGSQAALRDYLSASMAIWQEGVAATMQGAGAWSDTARETMQQWQQSMNGFPGSFGGAALPMREWMAAFERAVSPAAAAGDAAAKRTTQARRAADSGAHHAD